MAHERTSGQQQSSDSVTVYWSCVCTETSSGDSLVSYVDIPKAFDTGLSTDIELTAFTAVLPYADRLNHPPTASTLRKHLTPQSLA